MISRKCWALLAAYEEEFRRGIERSVRRVKQDLPYLIADQRPARFAGKHMPHSSGGQIVGKQRDLSGLARTFDSLEGDECSLHLFKLRNGISLRPERGVGSEQDHLGLRTKGAKDLAYGLLP